MKKILHGIMFTLLLISLLCSSHNFRRVKAAPIMIIVPDDYATIQAAVDAATNGDTIFVRNGTYSGSICIDKALSLIGEDRRAVIDRGGFLINSSNIAISSFTIQNCFRGIYGIGFGSDVLTHENVTIFDNTIKDCERGISNPPDFVEITYRISTITVINNSIIGNTFGIEGQGYEFLSIVGNFFADNEVAIGPTEIEGLPGNLEIKNNLIYLSTGYGIHLSDESRQGMIQYNITENHFWGNRYALGLTSYYGVGNHNGEIHGNEIQENTYGVYLEGFHEIAQSPYVYHNNFINNTHQTFVDSIASGRSTWDVGYPQGGNYWSDYNGTDVYTGPHQNLTASDGLGDIPYVIDVEDRDNYPLIEPLPIEIPTPPIPVHPVAFFTYIPSEPVVYETVTFDASISRDIDGDIISYFWNFDDSTNFTTTQSNITHFYTSTGIYNVTLTVIDDDGLNGTTSKLVQVDKIPSTISLAASPPEITIGENTTLSGTITPIREGANVTIWYRPGGEETWLMHLANTTDEEGAYSHVWIPQTPGVYELRATWSGDNYTLPAESSIETFACRQIEAFLSISTSSPSTQIGFKVTVNGTLMDEYGVGLQDETVVLYYTFSGITEWEPITSDTTNGSGGYVIEWEPPATGYFNILVEWGGNITHMYVNNTATVSILSYLDYMFTVESNSTISALAFNSTDWTLSFTATGPTAAGGYVRTTVAKILAPDPANIKVYLDDNQTACTITSVDDSWLLTLKYTHSIHQITMDLDTTIVPELPSLNILMSFLIIIFAFFVYRRNTH